MYLHRRCFRVQCKCIQYKWFTGTNWTCHECFKGKTLYDLVLVRLHLIVLILPSYAYTCTYLIRKDTWVYSTPQCNLLNHRQCESQLLTRLYPSPYSRRHDYYTHCYLRQIILKEGHGVLAFIYTEVINTERVCLRSEKCSTVSCHPSVTTRWTRLLRRTFGIAHDLQWLYGCVQTPKLPSTYDNDTAAGTFSVGSQQ